MSDREAQRIAEQVVQIVAELPDRTSPDDWPEAMLVTADELRDIVSDAVLAAPACDRPPEALLLDETILKIREIAFDWLHSTGDANAHATMKRIYDLADAKLHAALRTEQGRGAAAPDSERPKG